jgi:hypothetical protein
MMFVNMEELVGRIAMTPSRWTVAIFSGNQEMAILQSLCEELSRQLGAEEGESTTVDISELQTIEPSTNRVSLLVKGIEEASPPSLQALDLIRDRFIGGPRIILVMSERGIPALRDHAPNILSWIGPSVYHIRPTSLFGALKGNIEILGDIIAPVEEEEASR